MSSINSLEGCRCNQSFISSRSVSPGPNDSLDTDDDRDPYRVLVPNEEVNTEGDNNIGGSEDTDNDADTDDDEDTTDRMDSHNSKDTGDDKDDINISDTAPWRSAQTLREANGSKTFSVAGDCLILLLPFLFAVLALLALDFDRKVVSTRGNGLMAASKLGPSIFPVVFAAIASKSSHSLARRRVELGERLGTLELLLGSQSFAGTVIRIVELRSIHIMGFALLAIWALSPLGGQSALRLLSIEQGVIESTQTVFYTTGNDTSTELRESAMVAYYSASLLSATQTKDTPTDIWDNPKIPPLDTLGSIDDHGWRAVLNTSRTLYSSLVGVKLQGLCSDCNATFQIEASYLNTTCHDVSHFSTAEHNVTEIFVPANDTHWHVPERLNYNFTAHAGQVDQTLSMSSFIASRTDFADDTIDDVATILFIARGFAKLSETYSVFNCTLQEPKVEAEIKCTGSHCGVTRMRNIFRDTRWTPFHTAPQRVEDFFYKFPFAAGYTSRDQRSATDSFIFGDEASFKYARLPDWRKISLDDVSRRFSMVLNSLKQVSITPWAISNNYTVYTDPACGGVMLESAGNCKNMASTTATITRSTELYRASRLWIALLLISSLVLLVLGFMNIVLEPLCVAPDLLGYVSSMTRDNPYVDIPPGATALGGSRRARALKNIKVQISDVREDGDVGYIALRSISDEFDISKRRKFGRYRLYE